ncbi:MAG: hypothetical protein ACTSYI_08965 [Promethearchaeota archaeon]
MSIYEPHRLDAPRDEYGRFFRFQEKMPPVPADEHGIPLHPYWREYFYRRQVDPTCPTPIWSTRATPTKAEAIYGPQIYPPVNPVAKYYYLLSSWYWWFGADWRGYKTTRGCEEFLIPFPPADVVPQDGDGIPIHLYWMFQYFIYQTNPGHVLPPYDAKGIPLTSNSFRKYREFDERDFDRNAYLRERKKIKILSRTNATLQTYHYWGTVKQGLVFFPRLYDYPAITPPKQTNTLSCPTLDELARVYITTINPHSSVADLSLTRDTARFPLGFTDEHRSWLIACAPPSILAFLQAHAPLADPIVEAILLRGAKPLAGSTLSII